MNITDQDIILFNSVLKGSSAYDFTEYSEKSLKRRLAKVILDKKVDMPGLVSEMKRSRDFLERVIKDITVNTTELFRDPTIWQTLKYKVLPKYEKSPSINIWHAGCSTGQEVYSMLILLYEMGLFEKARVVGTDLNSDVLTQAAKGLYKYRFNISYLDNFDKVIRENPDKPDGHIDVPYSKYFEIDKTRDFIKMHSFLTDKPVFKKHDLVNEDNIFVNKFDIIICRNVIIYFNYDLQNKVFSLFRKNLFEGGCLVLGMHESILGPHTANFEKRDTLYFRK
jgi:chemotaxis protein methyltransferase CheR